MDARTVEALEVLAESLGVRFEVIRHWGKVSCVLVGREKTCAETVKFALMLLLAEAEGLVLP